MTYCELLYNKAEKCLEAGRKTKGLMREIWVNHYYKIMDIIKKSTIDELSRTVS